MTERFKVAPFGVTAWVWTVSFFVGLLYFGGTSAIMIANGLVPDTFDGGATVILIVLIIYAWLRSIRGYRLEGDMIIIDRAGPGKIHIPVTTITEVNSNPGLGNFFNIGFLSIGGVFGWAGRVRVRKATDINSVDADVYGTNPKNQLLLDMKSGSKIILTPSDPQAMETSLRIAGAGGTPQLAGARSKPKAVKTAKKR